MVIVLIMVGLALGWFTPLIAGAIGAVAFTGMVVLRRLTLLKSGLRTTLIDIIQQTAYSLAIVVAAFIFDRFMMLSGVPAAVQNALLYLPVDRWMTVAIIAGVFLLMGALLEAPFLMAVMLPVTYPVMIRLGFDPVWFGVFSVLLIEIGAILPPVGRNGFVVVTASDGAIASEDVFNGLSPYVLAALVIGALLCAFPQIALFLPSRMF